MSQLNFERFVDNLQKAIIADAIFDLYILWSRDKQSILHSNIAATAPSLPSPSTISSPKPIKSPPRALRAASIAVTQPPPKPQKGILRRAASSFRKKRSKPPEEQQQNLEYMTTTPATTSNIEMNRSSSISRSDTLDNIPTTSNSLPTSPRLDESNNRESASREPSREPVNFWSEPRSVVLQRHPNETFGISIVGGRVEVSQKGIEMATTSTLGSSSSPALSSTVSGIFIKSVIADSPAGRCGKLFMGDRLLKVNEIDLLNTTHENAVQAIKNASNPVCFVVQSLQSLQTFVAREKENSKKASLTSIISEGQTSLSIPPSPAIVEIDSASAAALEKDGEDEEVEDIFHYTKRKVLKKYSDLPGKPVLIRMPNIPPGGLGLILSTRRDEGANRPPVIVVGVKSDSPLSLKVGDELLEINGLVLFGLSHLEATEKIRKCCQHSSLSLLVLRKEEEATKEVQQQSTEKESTSTTTIETVVNTNLDNAPISPEKEYTSESECELGARTIVSEILARQQQQIPEVKIESVGYLTMIYEKKIFVRKNLSAK
ncbi:unnamed protein product [Meloidogyne enterolobii]|uniref:Uncharacterized protein n=1 Tax=Meloidogyne enterolobii TaxID=390850 RepID=A0ACB0ZL71_MELEN